MSKVKIHYVKGSALVMDSMKFEFNNWKFELNYLNDRGMVTDDPVETEGWMWVAETLVNLFPERFDGENGKEYFARYEEWRKENWDSEHFQKFPWVTSTAQFALAGWEFWGKTDMLGAWIELDFPEIQVLV